MLMRDTNTGNFQSRRFQQECGERGQPALSNVGLEWQAVGTASLQLTDRRRVGPDSQPIRRFGRVRSAWAGDRLQTMQTAQGGAESPTSMTFWF
jgi:hypothetical protein